MQDPAVPEPLLEGVSRERRIPLLAERRREGHETVARPPERHGAAVEGVLRIENGELPVRAAALAGLVEHERKVERPVPEPVEERRDLGTSNARANHPLLERFHLNQHEVRALRDAERRAVSGRFRRASAEERPHSGLLAGLGGVPGGPLTVRRQDIECVDIHHAPATQQRSLGEELVHGCGVPHTRAQRPDRRYACHDTRKERDAPADRASPRGRSLPALSSRPEQSERHRAGRTECDPAVIRPQESANALTDLPELADCAQGDQRHHVVEEAQVEHVCKRHEVSHDDRGGRNPAPPPSGHQGDGQRDKRGGRGRQDAPPPPELVVRHLGERDGGEADTEPGPEHRHRLHQRPFPGNR